jgi:putative PIG3 family NAD(P)H quinone oxidoreductase
VRAITLPSYGDADVLVPADVADPVAGPGEVLLDVVATAVNRADVMQRRGFYDPPPGASPYPGLECSGRIAALGDGVTGWSVGDEVCALLTGGGYATRVAVPAGQLLPVPTGLTLVEAAALPEVACTVWSNVFSLARLQAGEVLLVHGGTSGIGTMAVQLAARAGARVLCTVGSAEKATRALELGAERAVLYREEDFVAVVRAATSGAGADVVLDNMGAAYLPRNVEVLAVGGRLVVIGLQGGTRGELDLGALLVKRASVFATSLRARPPAEKAAIVAAIREHVWPAVETGEVRPVIDRVLPLDDAAQAHRVLESSAHIGKIVLVCTP